MDETNRDVIMDAVWRLALDLAGGEAVPAEAQGRLDLIHRMLDNALGLAAAGPPRAATFGLTRAEHEALGLP